ncbi:Ig domain-containing protein [Alicyclobacillus tolerans]|uniref:Ig domain-containing protein n=1 Tax=Alicyclobacillus tolerans TaxID=90970 RepID=UPI001F25BAE8|nr:Ig domain-containing protein [Alicyclobacillus tolerans]MCF8565128.1 Ig domain-containing protein [Alicyclobacillus tolerans]
MPQHRSILKRLPLRTGLFLAGSLVMVLPSAQSAYASNNITLSPVTVQYGYSPETVTITGTGFQSSSLIYVLNSQHQSQNAVSNVQYNSSTSMSFLLGSGLGSSSTDTSYTVEVETPLSSGVSIADGTLTVQALPAISGMTIGGSSNASWLGTGYSNANVTLTAANTTLSSQSQVQVEDSTGALSAGHISNLQINNGSTASFTLTSGLPAGSYSFVIASNGQTMSIPFLIRNPQPAMNSQEKLPAGLDSTVSFAATNANFTPGNVQVTLSQGGNASTPPTVSHTYTASVTDANHLTFSIPEADASSFSSSPVDLTVTDPSEQFTEQGAFVFTASPTAVAAPQAVTQDQAAGSTISVATTGLNLQAGTPTVSLNGNNVNSSPSFVVQGATVNVTLPSGLQPGNYQIKITDKDPQNPKTATATFAVTGTPPTLASATLPDATQGQPYSQTLGATGANLQWSITAGALPAGLTLSNGVISGTPTQSTTLPNNFTVQVSNSDGTAVQQYSLSIQPVAVAPVQNPGNNGNNNGSGGSDHSGHSSSSVGSGSSAQPGQTPTTPPSSAAGLEKNFNTAVATQSVSSAASKINTTADGSSIELDIPQNAFQSPEQVSVTRASTSSLENTTPQGYKPAFAFGVNFSGPAPTAPITLTILNPAIPENAVIYKVSGSKLVSVPAKVSNGKVEISFTSDPDFVIAVPVAATTTPPAPILPGQRAIDLNGKRLSVVNGVVKNGTTYMPIWYVMHAMSQLGMSSKWNGTDWNLLTPKGLHVDMSRLKPGFGQMQVDLNGTVVQKLYGIYVKDPSTGRDTTYMPIWYVMQILKRVGVQSAWNGQAWNMTSQSQG